MFIVFFKCRANWCKQSRPPIAHDLLWRQVALSVFIPLCLYSVYDLIQMFDLMQNVDKPTHRCGHILDWILHRRKDDILRTTHVSHQLTSDHFTIVCDLDLFVPSPPPTFTWKRKLSSIDNCILMQDIKQYLDSTVMFTAAQLDSVLRSLLDKHALMNNC